MLYVKEMPVEAKQKMFYAALHLFSSKGFKETSILEIVEKAHVSKSTFYQHFKTKEELLASLCEQLADDIFEEVERAVVEEEAIQHKAYRGILKYVEICFTETQVAKLLLVSSVGVSEEVETVRFNAYQHFADLIFKSVEKALPDTVSEKQIQLVAQAMVGAINQVVVQRFIKNSDDMGDEELASLLNKMVVGAFASLSY